MKIYELRYSGTNTYLIEGEKGRILFDTGWAGTFPAFCRAAGEIGIPVQEMDYILLSHFHPDHMGIAQEIAELGPVIVVMEVQSAFIHESDAIFARNRKDHYIPIVDDKVRRLPMSDGRAFLKELGIDGEILHTPGHSDDSISLCLDDGTFFVGDLNPLYELELHQGTEIGKTWARLLAMHPKTLYYGHARKAVLENWENPGKYGEDQEAQKHQRTEKDLYALTVRIMKYIDKKNSLDQIRRKTGADRTFIEDVARMYLTHQNVGPQGILDRIEIKNR
ncbi:MAG: MBL fold metallo-hydrolase [Blautia sp.]|nr:MBL fold metallo-hydrolase [Blautia sp.]